ncbi:MAG: 30S ribosomal protein S16 [Leptospirales bacterium]|nr:30S ribosomal protein S16 [Leptospirales bacterium]
MVRIRLQRYGTKNRPFYRVVAADIRAPRDGRFIEILGSFSSTSLKGEASLKEDRIRYWLGQGAQPSETVLSLLRKNGIAPSVRK